MDKTVTVDLDRHLPAILFALGAKISLHAQRENARDLGLDMCEWRVIQILGRDGASSVNGVADRIAMDRGGTSRAISRLVARGLVRREASGTDRRKSVVELTEAGREMHRKVAHFAVERERRLTEGLSAADKETLIRLLSGLNDEVDRMLATRWRPGA